MTKTSFERDAEKDQANQNKHGISFSTAQYAFADLRRVIARDETHSESEERFYCFGRVGSGVLVMFLRCGLLIAPHGFELLALAVNTTKGAKERQFMNAKIKHTNEPLGELKVKKDFLPSPAELAFNEEAVKVTLALSKKSIDFFKSEAVKNHTQYQRMIRRLVDAYVESHSAT